MLSPSLQQFVRSLRRTLGGDGHESLSDAELLHRFVSRHDEAAFEVLVWRHGAMVLGVCGRMLPRAEDAEDVFQATFLTLARKAASIARREALGCWLYRTAFRASLRARGRTARLAAWPLLSDVPAPPAGCAALWHDLRPVLDEEIDRLPERYRAAVVLCYLEGRTTEEAARRLGCARGTICSRLSWARQRLRARLTRRGMTVSAVTLAAALGECSRAAMPPALVEAAVRVAVPPAGAARAIPPRGAVRTGVTARTAALGLLVAVGLAVGAGVIVHQSAGGVGADRADKPAAKGSAEQKAGTDRWGDPLPAGAVARLGTVRFRHGECANCTAFAPDGKRLASGGGDNAVRLWDVPTGKQVREFLGHRDRVFGLAFTPDGKRIASASIDRTVRLWDVATGRELRQFGDKMSERYAVAFSPDGKLLAASTWDGRVHLWDVATAREVRTLRGHNQRVFGIAFSPDGTRLASAGWEDSTVRLWDVATGRELRQLGDKTSERCAVAFSPDGKLLAGGGREGPIRLWDVTTGKEVRHLSGHEGFVNTLSFTPGGKTLASSSYDHTVRLWDVASGKELRTLGKHLGMVNSASLSPDGTLVASAGDDQLVRLWETGTGKEIRPGRGHEQAATSAVILPGGAVVSGGRDGTVRVWDGATGKEMRSWHANRGRVSALALAPSGKLLATAGVDGTVHLWDVTSGTKVRSFPGGHAWERCLAFSPDGKLLTCSADRGATISLREVSTGKELRRLKSSAQQSIRSVAFAPDGQTLAMSENKGTLKGANGAISLWDVATGSELRRWPAKGPIYALAFAPDGRTLAGGSWTSEVFLWEPETGHVRDTLRGHQAWVYCLAFAPDGRTLVSGCEGRTVEDGRSERAIIAWDVLAGKERCRLLGHRGTVNTLAFAPDGRTLASASNDTTVLLWEATRWARQRREGAELGPAELGRLWGALGQEDARGAFRAVGALAASPRQSVPFLRKRLKPVPAAPDGGKVARAIAGLDSSAFAARQRATEELERFGETVEGALRKALEGSPSLEKRRRLERLLARLAGSSPERLRTLRALEALEKAATPEAVDLLRELGRGAAGAWLTREAEGCLKRLARQRGAR